MNRLLVRLTFLLTCCFAGGSVLAQFFPEKKYPQQYFRWPVGADTGIVANFGELRPNHYHMGFDCRTNQKVNMPVYAAAAGYISRVKIEPFGFGRSIMIDHPNGYSTLYAHLNNFYPELEKYITDQQYKLQQWDVMIMLPENMFKVAQSDLIAYSGNTGGSQGPHVHFEIRNTKTEKVFNPALFNLPIPDTVPPSIIRLAVYNRNLSTYEQSPKLFPLKKKDSTYRLATDTLLVNTDKVSFGISTFDRVSGSSNPNGIYSAIIYDNGEAISGFEIDNISYDETRAMNAHIDYKTRSSGGAFIEHLSRLPGYNNGIYTATRSDGVVYLNDTLPHDIKAVIADANGNKSILEFVVKRSLITENNMAAAKGMMFYPGYINVFENANILFYLPENCIYDSFHFVYNEVDSKTGQPVYMLHNTSVPLNGYFPLRIRTEFSMDDTSKVVMKRFSGGKEDYKKAVYENGWYKASFRELGNFQLLIDKTPPSIVPIGFKDKMKTKKLTRIRFSVTDNTEEIKKFTATLDGNWLRFTNDKARVFVYEFDERCGEGEHELIITAEDQAGNKTEKIYHFTK